MSNELIAKIIRYFVIALSFLCVLTIIGVENREAQRIGMILGLTVIFSVLLRNIWITLFLCWTVFLYAFFRFKAGEIYLSSVFYGCILYYLTKLVFKKEHIRLFMNGILWVLFLNLGYVILQAIGYDFIGDVKPAFSLPYLFSSWHKPAITGFMWNAGVMGCLMALNVPILASRGTKAAFFGSIGLFIPIFLARSSIACLGAIFGLLFVLWFKLPRRLWFATLILIAALGCIYVKYDPLDNTRAKHWKDVLTECVVHPVTGWGLDSFRKITPEKHFLFAAKIEKNKDQINVSQWDNPHNLLISVWFEFGLVGLFLIGGYLRQCGLLFKDAVKDNNTIGLAGFILVFLVISMGQFPIYLARMAVLIIPAFALFEISAQKPYG